MEHIADLLAQHVDPTCELCGESLAEMKAEGTNPDVYGCYNMASKEMVLGYVLRPDRNCSGCVTHWHVSKQKPKGGSP
jgi:hypothetical protein